MNAPAKIDRQAVELDDAGVKLRVEALAARHLNALDAAAAKTDHPTTLANIGNYRAKVRKYLRWSREAGKRSTALGMLGHNGYAPAIADVCRAAAFYGFTWQARRFALMASVKPVQVQA